MRGRVLLLTMLVASVAHGQNQAPTTTSLNPIASAGLTQTWTFTFSDPNGASDLGVLNVLINGFLDGRRACYIAFANLANVLYLVNDGGDGLSPGLTLGGAGTASNGQCGVNGMGSSVTRAGNNLTLTLAMTFNPSFAGDKVIYLAARDAMEANSGWQAYGVHRVPRTVPTYPTTVSLSPNSGAGGVPTYTVVYQDAVASTNLRAAQLLVNTALDGRNACYLGYERATNLIYLFNDSGSTLLLPGVAPLKAGVVGSGTGSIENQQCRVNGAGSQVTESGATLTLSVNIEFKSGFSGRKTVYTGIQTVGGGRKLFARRVDATIYALPLIASGVDLPGNVRRNLLIAATMRNTVYAFDADSPTETAPVWSRNLGFPAPGDPWIGPFTCGILGTPVIDRATGTIYVAAKLTASLGLIVKQQLFALDLATGALKFNSPVDVTYPVAGTSTTAYAPNSIQRPGLLVSNGVLYVAFANIILDPTEWRSQEGYVQSFDATNLQIRHASFQVTPTGLKGGIWQAGRGLSVDATGNVYVATAGGEYNGIDNFGSTILKLAPRTLAVVDWFTPSNWDALYRGNLDLSANGVTLIPSTNLAFAGGKEGVIYLLDRANLGRLEGGSSGPLQRFQASQGCGQTDCAQTLGTAFWSRAGGLDGMLYVWDRRDFLRAYRFSNATNRFVLTPTVGSLRIEQTSGPTVSSLGDDLATGIVWAVTVPTDANGTLTEATLRAYAADDITRELYNSDTNRARDRLGFFTKFAPPVVANGKVYVSTHSNEIVVYGRLP
ncbi:MAG: hypothetical protein NTV52_35305 [Acidobacteria bacterium]|nr:hypothetical protein [Acidobacteriota bacterium]